MWLFLRTTAMFAMVCILLGWPGVVRNSTYVLGYQDGTVRTLLYDVIASVGRVHYRTVLDGNVPYDTVGREGGTVPGPVL